jgi:hypothetical protein
MMEHKPKLKVGDLVEVVFPDCESSGKIGVVAELGMPEGGGNIAARIELLEDGFETTFVFRSSLRYLGPSKTAEEVLGPDYFF